MGQRLCEDPGGRAADRAEESGGEALVRQHRENTLSSVLWGHSGLGLVGLGYVMGVQEDKFGLCLLGTVGSSSYRVVSP